MKKLACWLLFVVLTACGGEEHLSQHHFTVVPSEQLQHSVEGETAVVFPYRDMSEPTIQNAFALGHTNNARWQYIYDEMFWHNLHIDVGYQEPEITALAERTRKEGFQVAVNIPPEIVLQASFKLVSPNSYDVILLSEYPATFFQIDPALGKYYSTFPNKYIAFLQDAMKKLRDMGYTGEIWYVYQNRDDMLFPPTPNADVEFALQEEAIKWGHKNGISGFVKYNITP